MNCIMCEHASSDGFDTRPQCDKIFEACPLCGSKQLKKVNSKCCISCQGWHHINEGRGRGQTECCFFDAPCKDHIEDKKKEILLDNDWRDARKELPDDRRDVIIGNAKCVSVGWWNGEHNNSEGKWLIRTAHFDGDVTHWKELPDPPDSEKVFQYRNNL